MQPAAGAINKVPFGADEVSVTTKTLAPNVYLTVVLDASHSMSPGDREVVIASLEDLLKVLPQNLHCAST